MEKVTKLLIAVSILFALTLSIFSCRGNFYFNRNEIWISNGENIKINFRENAFYIRRNNITHEFAYFLANDGTSFDLYYVESINNGNLTDDDILIIAEAEEKKDRLYLTFTLDKLFDLEGKTVILDPVTSE